MNIDVQFNDDREITDEIISRKSIVVVKRLKFQKGVEKPSPKNSSPQGRLSF